MAVKIRLTRRGRKKLAMFDLIVADSRSPRDGRFIEKIGAYNPQTNPATIDINEEKALDWLLKGAQPTDTARRILSYKGILMKKHLQVGVLKGAVTQEDADKRFEDWKNSKEEKIAGKVDTLSQKKAEAHKVRLAAETKVKEAKAEAVRKKLAVEEPIEEVAETATEAPEAVVETTETKTEAVEAPKAEETKAEEAETPKAEKVEDKSTAEEAPKQEEPKAEKVEAPAKEEAKTEEAEAPAAKAEETEAPKAEKEEADPSEESKEDKK